MKTCSSTRAFLRFSLLTILLALVPASNALALGLGLNVAVLSTDAYAWDVHDKLVTSGQFASVTVLNPSGASTYVLTLSTLQLYDAVLVYVQYSAPPASWGPALLQYVQNGGGVVTACNVNSSNDPLTGFNDQAAYQTLVPNAGWQGGGTVLTLGTVLLPNHPIMNGVTSFNNGLSNMYSTSTTISPSAYIVAKYSNGHPLVVARENVGPKSAHLADLNFYPPSSSASTLPWWVAATDGGLMMANALTWVARGLDFSIQAITNPVDQSFKSINIPFIPTVQILNQSTGVSTPTSVTVRFQISPFGGAPIYSYDSVLSGANIPAPFVLMTIQFPPFTPTANNFYEATVILLNFLPVSDQKPQTNSWKSDFTVSPPNNVRPLAFVDPLANSYASAGTLTPMIVDFRNIGGNDEANVPVTAVIMNQDSVVVYRDTQIVPSWPSGLVREATFKNWSLPPGPYTFYAITLLANDQQRSDDTLSVTQVHVRYDYDAAAIGIVNPQPNEEKPYTLSWQPTAVFQSHGAQDLFNVPVRIQIRRCSDGTLVFQSDSTIEALNTDQNQYFFSFPSKQGMYNISNLMPGCYTISAITLYPNDADRTNDTTYSTFSVIDRLKGDYFVGVGRQFPSIHAAIDSLRFRGVGGNVRLILTDNNYTEDGTDTASVYNYPARTHRVSNYQVTPFTATWTDITTTGIPIIPTDLDDGFAPLTLPFDILYDSSVVPAGTVIRVGSNGALSFTNITPGSGNALANSADPGFVCLFSANMYVTGPYDYYQVDGLPPERVLTVEYPSIHQYPLAGVPVTAMQVKFYETTGEVDFIYRNHTLNMGMVGGIGLNGFSPTSTPSEPLFVSKSYSSVATTPATDLRWQSPTGVTGALSFQGIRGLADTATVTWMPNAGVTPHITFTGTNTYGFYFGDGFGGHMTFEGYNPTGAWVPDQLVPEPNKRGITIVNNSTTPGSIFDIEEGASNITLKDLVLKNNGNFTKDSSAAIRIYNEQNRNLYIGTGAPNPIRDTVPIHNIRIENCELGNAKYGIWDHALHTQFNVGRSVFVDWRNYNNVFTRNTIGTSASLLSYAGIQFNNEQNLTISHNEISNVTGSLGGFLNVYGIDQPSVLQSDTGNVVGVWIDANRVHNLIASDSAYGIAFQQAATIYTVGSGLNPVRSVLPAVTSNRATNNMIYDLRGAVTNFPLMYNTSSMAYTTDRDSVFNNSISIRGNQVPGSAPATIFVAQSKHAFLWNNIIQNTGAGPYTNYSLQLPRPFQSAVSSDYNLFDLRGTNTFATVNEYDLNSGTLIQTRSFRRLNDWRTYTQQDLHSLAGDPLFSSDSLHLPGSLSYIESPASNNGAWLGTATQLRDFDGDLRLQGNQTPDIGADEFDGFQNTNDLAVLSITTPAGYSATSDTTSVTIENPLWVTAQVKNLSSQAVFNVPVSALVEIAISGGPWTTIYSSTTSPLNFEVNETKSVTFQGPAITQAQAQTGVFRITVSVPNDQNNANNAAQKVFRVLIKNNATLVSYTSASVAGQRDRDSVTAALRRLSIAYDSLDRHAYGSLDIDYTPWWTMIWSGDTTAGFRDSIPPRAVGRVNIYTPTNFTATTWTDIATTGTAFTISSVYGAVYGSVPLPFDFPYDSTVIPAGTILHAGVDGAIGLDPNVVLPVSYPSPIPVAVGSATYPGLLCFFQGGGYNSGATYYYQVDGTQPNRVLTIEYSGWYNISEALVSPVLRQHIQVKLYETTGQIEFIYLEHNLVTPTAIYYNSIGLNGLSATTHPSAASFTSQAYPGYATPQASTPATDIRWIALYQPSTLSVPGAGALSFKETQDVERFLQAGQNYAKKSLVMAGQNIAFYNAFIQVNNSVTDTEFMKSYLHTVYRANSPVSGAYNGMIQGQQTDYWKFADHLNSTSPDVVAPSFKTPTVGSEITGFAYAYLTHPATPADSGAGTTYTNPKINTVFYGFDWSDPTQTTPSEAGSLTSGTTRILKGALDFITSHSGTILPVEFTDVTARRVNGNGLISWTTAHQSDVARFEIERQEEGGTGAGDGTLHGATAWQVPSPAPDFSTVGSVGADQDAFTDAGIDPTKSYTYRIAAIDLSGAKTYSPEAEIGPDVSADFTLDQNYPNPANGLTTIRFNLPVDAVITLRILDVTGKVVSTEITNESMPVGEQAYTLDASKYASGSYIYELTTVQPNGHAVTLTKKMTLDK